MTRAPGEQGSRKPTGRAERLAAALRENLHKRKKQARGRQERGAGHQESGIGGRKRHSPSDI